jgi:hypothetical protein
MLTTVREEKPPIVSWMQDRCKCRAIPALLSMKELLMGFRPPLPRPKSTCSRREPKRNYRKWEPKPKAPFRRYGK